MNDAIWLTCDKKPAESQFSPTHASTKKDNETTKTKRTVVRSPWRQSGWSPVGSPVGRRGSMVGRICGSGVSWVWNGRERKWWMVWLWWQMMNEVDGMKQEDYSKDWVMHIPQWTICDFERGRWGWTSDGDKRWRTSTARRLNRDQVMEAGWAVERISYVTERKNLYIYLYSVAAFSDLGIYLDADLSMYCLYIADTHSNS